MEEGKRLLGGFLMKVLAALDETAAASSVLAASHEIARVYGADVTAVHVGQAGAERVRAIAAEDRVTLAELDGSPGARLAQALDGDDDAAALVVGTRVRAQGQREIGSTALEVITTAHKPVFAIPTELPARFAVNRVLVPLEGTPATSSAYPLAETPAAREIDIVILYVLEPAAIPAFSDQPQHEWEVFAREFLTRYSPWPIDHVRLEIRVGRPEEYILPVARETNCDVIALAWTQELAPGRASIVRDTLRHGMVPVVLVPLSAG
jgi:nucleotide-binding universal stress UspA family protein